MTAEGHTLVIRLMYGLVARFSHALHLAELGLVRETHQLV